MTAIKNTNGFIFGGFTSVPWYPSNDGRFKTDSTAFLFSLTNPSNTPLKLKVSDPKKAAFIFAGFGPTFGNGRDLCVSSLSNINRHSYMKFRSYEFPNGMGDIEGGKFVLGGSDHFFQTVEIEVFWVL